MGRPVETGETDFVERKKNLVGHDPLWGHDPPMGNPADVVGRDGRNRFCCRKKSLVDHDPLRGHDPLMGNPPGDVEANNFFFFLHKEMKAGD